jgi:bifunctional DNA-binding transcriptional regulator/antitoxin component of YhaV-PrlF toxin-antitoxin module
MVKTIIMNSHGTLTVPKKLRSRLGDLGQPIKVVVEEIEGGLSLRPANGTAVGSDTEKEVL